MWLFIVPFEKIESFVCSVVFGREANTADLLVGTVSGADGGICACR